MKYVIPVFVIICCIPAVFIPTNRVQSIVWMIVGAGILGLVGFALPYLFTPAFLTDHSWIANTPLHPELSIFWGGVAVLFAFGLILALTCRSVLMYFKILKIK